MIQFDNSYARLPEGFFARVTPTPVAEPHLLALNAPLATRLGLDADWLQSPEGVAMLSGNGLPEGADPIAQAYAGHQFGGFVPQLGDGRAVLLGEVIAPDRARFDIQLKGSGPTPFSRRGDGRAWMGPVLREYLVSEFMHAMGVPTTRALAAVSTGETVWRENRLPGAVLTRVAASHIRVGTFQYFAVRGNEQALRELTDYVIQRHYPAANGPLSLLDHVVARQAETIAQWMALGFIHGVMNTDNMAISGETIDYGPCAFMDGYHPNKVFSSIDVKGRYAWAQQPQIAVWNLAQFATCLIPLMGEHNAAVEAATKSVHHFAPLYQAAWLRRFGEKLGLAGSDRILPMSEALLTLMAQQDADFTRVFAGLSDGSARDEFRDPAAFDSWATDWRALNPDPELLAHANPVRIPRNHRIEEIIASAVAGDLAPFNRLFAAVTHPREALAEWDDLAQPPKPDEVVRQTFCGT
ncbi:protein adenylyltransferase SelO [Paracoccus fistulariae]|uniref:Protein nucleotidyltransferase YdiU n=1 Tax=Paracoccus fistulariae TaxID=658446 RepID=A0ABY7SLX1_9RHOB|nr:YdiU family protein [Paracoccus fistulariae]MDB6179816.1 YdiU family protein [Paracoccus fistulariae]WCR07923.1 YdiU family protein [Paracoccus fistulariae]